MTKIKGGKEVTRQNFSMHPDLMQAIMGTAHQLNHERAAEIVEDRSKRVTFSKVVAALAWLLQTRYLDENDQPTNALRQLISAYEGSDYEKVDEPKKKRASASPDGAV